MDEQSPYISLSEAGRLSGYSAEYLRQLCVKGKLGGQKIGKSWVVSSKELNKFMGLASVETPTFGEIKSADFFVPEANPARPFKFKKIAVMATLLVLVAAPAAAMLGLPDAIQGLKTQYKELAAQTQATFKNFMGEKRANSNASSSDEKLDKILSMLEQGKVAGTSILQSDSEGPYEILDSVQNDKPRDWTPPQSSIPTSQSPKVLGISNNEIIAAFRATLQEGLPQDILSQLKGEKGDAGVTVGYTAPTSTNTSSQGSIAGFTHLSGQDLSAQTLTVSSLSSFQSVTINNTLNVSGTTTLNSLLSFSGTNHAGLRLNNLTSAQRDALTGSAGMLIFNTTATKMQVYNGSAWKNVGNPEIGAEVTSGSSGSVLFVDSQGFLAQDNTNFFWDNSTHRLGIGTTGPAALMHIDDTVGNNVTLLLQRDSNAAFGPSLQLYNNRGAVAQVNDESGYLTFLTRDSAGSKIVTAQITSLVKNATAGSAAGTLQFLTTNDGGATTNKVVMDQTGNFGIGTTGPASKLDVRVSDASINANANLLTLVHNTSGTVVNQSPFEVDTNGTLATNLTAYYKLDETAAYRYDGATQGNDVADNNTVTANSGKKGNAGQFVRANSEYLSRADTTTMSVQDIDFTFAVWVYFDSVPVGGGAHYILCKDPSEYCLFYDSGAPSNNRFGFNVQKADNSGSVNVAANTFGVPTTGTWYFVVAYHDSVNDQIGICINNGTCDTAAISGGVRDSTGNFNIGALRSSSGWWDGRIDELGFWKKKLSAQEITDLYNSGNGNTCTVDCNNPNNTSIASGLLFKNQDTNGDSEDTARISAILTNPLNSSEGSALTFLTRSGGGALTEQMRINKDGKVFIGASQPISQADETLADTKLLVSQSGGGITSGAIVVSTRSNSSNDNRGARIRFDTTSVSTGRQWDIGVCGSWGPCGPGNFMIYDQYADQTRFGIDSTGNAYVTNGAFCVDNDQTFCPSSPTAGRLYSINATVLTDDLAEYMRSSQGLETGDVVAVDPDFANTIERTYEQERRSEELGVAKGLDEIGVKRAVVGQAPVIGIVSTKPGITLGGFEPTEDDYEIALTGRVPVKVSEENGPIIIGDRLTVSETIPGYAMKMTESGQSIGVALEASSGGASENKILAFVNLGYQKIGVAQTSSGQIVVADGDHDLNGFSLLNVKTIVSVNGKWSIDENGVIVVVEIQAKKGKFEQLEVKNPEQSKTGITIYDRITGSPVCVYSENNILKSEAGECGQIAGETVPPPAEEPPPESPAGEEEPPNP